ncbi:MAG: ribonuclease HI family protein [Proteobacteria bacterium]|jgi:ribonuclease HI|nr:ribonuclease HI family protein [Pseudomonadota bacterium]
MMEWHIYIDGASSGNPGESGAGIIVFDNNGNELFRDSIYLGQMTNNMAEYEALIFALQKAKKSLIKKVSVYTDSLLVTNQIHGKYKVKNTKLRKYVEETKNIIRNFNSFALKYIPREENKIADKLAKDAVNKKG